MGRNIPTDIAINLNQSIWQGDYCDRIIRNERMYQNITNYILNNPQKREENKLNQK